MPTKVSLLVATLVFGAIVSSLQAGCADRVVSCDDICQCQGNGTADKTCVATCRSAEAGAKKQAQKARCNVEYVELAKCESDNATCDDNKQYASPAGVCDSRAEAYAQCAHAISGTTGSSGSSTGTGA